MIDEDIDELIDDEEVEEITIWDLVNEVCYYNKTHPETYTLKEYLLKILNYDEEEANELSTYYNIFMNYS